MNGVLWRGIVLLAWKPTAALLYGSMSTVSTLLPRWPDNSLTYSTTSWGSWRLSAAQPTSESTFWMSMSSYKNRTAERFDIDVDEAEKLWARRWPLPQRRQRQAAEAVAPAGVVPAASVGTLACGLLRNTTVGYYLHRAVFHFYQRIGNQAASAFATFVNNEARIGTLRRTRGTQTKSDVVYSPHETAALLADHAFMTELVYRLGFVRAVRTVFSVLSIVDRFSEVSGVPDNKNVIACLSAHVALVIMKIRSHLKRQAASQTDWGDVADLSPGLNTGHRTEWVKELTVVRNLFVAQGARTSNGLRLVDGTAPHRDDPFHRERVPAGFAQPLPAAPADVNPPSTTTALGTADGEEDGDAPGPLERAAVAAARAAIAHGMEGVYIRGF